MYAIKVVIACACATAALAAQIQGTVMDNSGKAIPNVSIRISSLKLFPSTPSTANNPSPPDTIPAQISAVTDGDGKYALTGVADGEYRMCALDAGLHLDPCVWSDGIRVNVTKGVSVRQDIQLQTGVRLIVSIRDPRSGAKLDAVTRDLVAFGRVSIAGRTSGAGLDLRRVGPLDWELSAVVPQQLGNTLQVVIPQQKFGDRTGLISSIDGSLLLNLPLRSVSASTTPVNNSSPRGIGNQRKPSSAVISLDLR